MFKKKKYKDVKGKQKIPGITPLRLGLKAIEEHYKKMEKWQSTFNEMFDGFAHYSGDDELVSSIIEILKFMYKENYEDDIISWWIYEKDFGKRKEFNVYNSNTKEIIPTDTVEDIYRYLIEHNFD